MNSSPKFNSLCGFILIDKPENVTSTHVVRKVKKSLHISRVGHLGTLDPFATGLLPIMVGGATRLSDELMDLDKQYLFTIKLGIETDTLDGTGQTIKEALVPMTISEDVICKTLQNHFFGKISQTPPVYSALKMDGRPLYEYMRATGKLPYDIQTKTRDVTIHQIDLVHFDDDQNFISIRVRCSKGTYIRSLARDISYSLGTVGFCSELRREKIGYFSVDNALQLTEETILGKVDISQELFNALILPIKILPNLIVINFLENVRVKLLSGNIFILSEEDDKHTFEKLNNYLNINPSAKFFSKIKNDDSILFLSEAEIIDLETIKIKPRKKLL